MKTLLSIREFVQQGNLVTIVSDGVFGIVSGNTLSASVSELLTDTVTLTVTWELELSSDGSSFTGTNTVGFADSQNPGEDCETVVNVSGTRTTTCDVR